MRNISYRAFSISTPIAQLLDKPFDVIVKQFTKAFSRMHDYKSYDDDDYFENALSILENQSRERLINVDELPTVKKFLSLDTPELSIKDVISLRWSNSNSKEKQQEGLYDKICGLKNVDDSKWYSEIFPDFDYKINSLGLRSSLELSDLRDNEFIPVFGCSHTYGVGLPEEWLWYNQLDEKLPIFNCAVTSGTTQDAYILLKKLYETVKFKKAYVVIPHSERMSMVSNKNLVEGIVSTSDEFLKQYSDLSILNTSTRYFYNTITTDALINFCKVNDIELCLYNKVSVLSLNDIAKAKIYVPPSYYHYQMIIPNLRTVNDTQLDQYDYPLYVARDRIHFGKKWHEFIAKTLTTNT